MASQNPSTDMESQYPDSLSSSPRSVGRGRGNDLDDAFLPRVRFMCSYGGRILPRPHDNQLRYVGGDTRIVAVSRNISYSVLISKLSKICGSNVTLKYQLPNEDLDALISVTTDEDLENMMEEYDRLNKSSSSSSRLRLFLFPAKLENATSLGSLLEGSKREHWFVDALNGVPLLSRGRSEVSSLASEGPDYLFGLDSIEDWDRDDRGSKPPGSIPPVPVRKSRLNLNSQSQEEHSAPGSPMPESSPYGSTSSASPCIDSGMLDLPPVKVEPDGFDPVTSEALDHEFLLHPPQRAVAPQEIGLRTQDPRLVFEDHMTKIIFNKPDSAARNKNSPETPPQEFQQLNISKQEQPFDLVPEDVNRYETPRIIANPAAKSPPSLPGGQKDGSPREIRREGSNSSIASMKREGSGSNLSAYGEDSRNPQQQQQERYKPVPAEIRPDEFYKPAPEMLPQLPQIPAEHYMEFAQPTHYVQQGQHYWQIHDDPSGPVYVVAAGAAAGAPPPAVLQPLPRQQQTPAYVPVQRHPVSSPYAADVLAAKSAQAVPPGPLMTQKLSGVPPTSYPVKPAGIPLYRAARPVASEMRVMMRPSAMMPPADQYAYQQVTYETTNPSQQMYYTQKATVMNPQYQGMVPPVTVDVQAAAETNLEPGQLLTRVSQSL